VDDSGAAGDGDIVGADAGRRGVGAFQRLGAGVHDRRLVGGVGGEVALHAGGVGAEGLERLEVGVVVEEVVDVGLDLVVGVGGAGGQRRNELAEAVDPGHVGAGGVDGDGHLDLIGAPVVEVPLGTGVGGGRVVDG